ncbi:hypothetical protein J2128_002243 [Methanomicrobium sp. W14]|uniref:hypothetical protein n=1 Tax=Methanomicrobium sp. W14 TaxID=2817839 RepID=UPI001AEB231D|nr:hypothetical protein [Methanomicrobium sp. W14]MBP2134277.1 hypothetical protein [Methanomicrobium sp. W14]
MSDESDRIFVLDNKGLKSVENVTFSGSENTVYYAESFIMNCFDEGSNSVCSSSECIRIFFPDNNTKKYSSN